MNPIKLPAPPSQRSQEARRSKLEKYLHRVVGDARLLGLIFVTLGAGGTALCMLPTPFRIQTIAASCGLFLLAPGTLYLVAAYQLKKRLPQGARLASWAAASHIVAIVGSIGLVILTQGQRQVRYALVPATVTVFFVPALIVFVVSTIKAKRIAAELEDSNNRFEVVPMQTERLAVDARPTVSDPSTSAEK